MSQQVDIGSATTASSSPSIISPQRQESINKVCACLAGALVMGIGGLVIGLICASPQDRAIVAVLAGGGGAVAGLLFGRRIALTKTVLGGAVIGGLIPFGMILLHLLRSGRGIDLNDFNRPETLPIPGGIFLAGATVGALLVATRKVLFRLYVPAPSRAQADEA